MDTSQARAPKSAPTNTSHSNISMRPQPQAELLQALSRKVYAFQFGELGIATASMMLTMQVFPREVLETMWGRTSTLISSLLIGLAGFSSYLLFLIHRRHLVSTSSNTGCSEGSVDEKQKENAKCPTVSLLRKAAPAFYLAACVLLGLAIGVEVVAVDTYLSWASSHRTDPTNNLSTTWAPTTLTVYVIYMDYLLLSMLLTMANTNLYHTPEATQNPIPDLGIDNAKPWWKRRCRWRPSHILRVRAQIIGFFIFTVVISPHFIFMPSALVPGGVAYLGLSSPSLMVMTPGGFAVTVGVCCVLLRTLYLSNDNLLRKMAGLVVRATEEGGLETVRWREGWVDDQDGDSEGKQAVEVRLIDSPRVEMGSSKYGAIAAGSEGMASEMMNRMGWGETWVLYLLVGGNVVVETWWPQYQSGHRRPSEEP
ncbi:hypothetical protein HK102_012286 [Quaeritorhiza haematococci]|nr:hypothetical protein HK102_012286 [Quaeritorhiza haematococci]